MLIIRKIIIYCLGLFIMAIGITFSIKSNLGISPVNSVPYVISLFTPLSQGIWIIVIFSSFILVQILLLRRDFKPVNLFQILFSSIYGYFVTWSNSLLSFTAPTNYALRLILLAISIILVAIGLILYLKANLMPLPAEGCILAIQTKTGIVFHKIKSSFDITMVTISISLSFIFMGHLLGIREGTVIAAIFIGKPSAFSRNGSNHS